MFAHFRLLFFSVPFLLTLPLRCHREFRATDEPISARAKLRLPGICGYPGRPERARYYLSELYEGRRHPGRFQRRQLAEFTTRNIAV